MQNTALNEVFTDEYVNSVNDGLDHLSKVFVESCAATAYNEVIFEAAMDDEVLSEADNAHSTFTGIKNAAFKAIQTLKMAFKSIFNKIRVAINEFIKNQNEKKVIDAVKTYNKNKSGDHDPHKKFIFNAKPLNENITVAEAGITNNENIFVIISKVIKG